MSDLKQSILGYPGQHLKAEINFLTMTQGLESQLSRTFVESEANLIESETSEWPSGLSFKPGFVIKWNEGTLS